MTARLGGLRGASTALRLLQGGLAENTASQYGRLFANFAAYCDEEGVSPLPASTATVICYVGHLAEQGTWAASSMQPIFSAINDAHKALELEPPAKDSHFLTRERAGLERAQAAVATTDSRTPAPAEAPMAFLADAESTPDSELARLRANVCLVLTALFCGRQDTSVHLRSEDINVTSSEIWMRLTEKGKRARRMRRVVRLPLAQTAVAGVQSALPRLAAQLQRYFALRESSGGPVPEFAFQLRGEAKPTTQSTERWLAAALERVGIHAPPGFAYLGHSLRSLGASACAAIGVPRHIYIWLGGWTRGSSVVDRHYVDPTFQPSPAALALYGWALTAQYRADAASPERASALDQPLAPAALARPPTQRDTPPHRVAARAIAQRAR